MPISSVGVRDVFKLPSAFDKNEWFVLAGMAMAVCCYIAVPRILSRSLTVTIFLTFAAFGLTADVLIGVDYPVDFYTIMDSPKLELFDLLVYSVNYPLYGYFYAYAILKFELDAKRLAWFIPCWSGLTALLE